MDVFVYGTLKHRERVAEVLGDAVDGEASDADATAGDGTDGARSSWAFVGDATVRGLHRVDGRYPTLAPGGRVTGRILRTDAVEALDAYEGVESGLYVRASVPTVADASGTDADAAVAVYVGDPERLDPVRAVTWPGDGDLEARVRRYVDANDVVVERE